MKNKKMVATLASLCLIVVAVVAAVVGVLAAVTQSVSNTFTVNYVAKNVHATVELKSIGPNSGATAYETTYTAAASPALTSQTFLPMNAVVPTTLVGNEYDFSWDSTGANFLGAAIYQFRFTNEYGAGGHALQVTPSIQDVSDDNVAILMFTSTSASLALSNVETHWAPATGALDQTAESATEFGLKEATGYTSYTTGSFTVNAAATTYFYLIVALKNASDDLTSYNLGGKISFTLTDPTSAS